MTEGRFTYYWLNRDGTAHTAASNENYSGHWRHWMPEPLRLAKKVWVQGPKGGTQLVRPAWGWESDRETGWNQVGYITNIPEAMSEFSWIVLTAQPINIRI